MQDTVVHIPQLTNTRYEALEGEEDNGENETKSTGLENNRKSTGVRHDNEITGVDSNNESTESGSTGATNEADEMSLIE